MKPSEMPEFLGKLVCPIQLGRRVFDPKRKEHRVDPVTKKRACWAYLRGNRRRRPHAFSREDWGKHLWGTETFYFAAAQDGDHCLIMVDIDCKNGVGSRPGALAFVEFLRTLPGFEALWSERSTGGVGIHAYIIVDRAGIEAAVVNKGIKSLERWLRRLFEDNRGRFDISGVEVKGTCPVFVRMRNGASSYTFGQFAKYPRDLMSESRCESFTKTTRLTVPQMIALGRESRKKARAARRALVVREGDPPTIPIRPAGALAARGSTDAPSLRPELLGAIAGTFLDTARAILPDPTRTRDGKRVVAAHHLAVAIAIVRHCREYPNKDGSFPQARAQALWTKLYEAGYADSPWDHDRWARLRDLLEQYGAVAWASRDFVVGRTYGDTYVKGQATRWEGAGFLLAIPEEHWAPADAEGDQEDPAGRGGSLGAVRPLGVRLPDGSEVRLEHWVPRRPIFAGFIDDFRRRSG